MKKVLSIMFALILIVSMATTVFAAKGDKLTIKAITLDKNVDVEFAAQGGEKDLSKLFDGKLVETASKYDTDGIVLFKNKKSTSAGVYTEYTLTIELDKVSTIGSIDLGIYHQYSAMIGVSKDNKIKVQKSSDGTGFLPVETVTFEGKAEEGKVGVVESTINFKNAFDAKFIKLTFTYGDSPFTTDGKVIWEWHGLTEIAVVEGEKTAETSAPETETPPTSDLYLVFVAVAAVSLVGAVVVTRKARRA